MKSVAIALVLLALVINGQIFAQESSNTTTSTTSTTPPPETTTTPTTQPTPSTTNSTTTTSTTTTPSTTSAPPKTTTPGTSTTTTPAPSKWPNNVQQWDVEDGNVTCIKFRAAMRLEIPYKNEAGANVTALVDVPMRSKGVGVCGNETQTLTLSWECVDDPKHVNTLTFAFYYNSSTGKEAPGKVAPGKFALVSVTGTVYQDGTAFVNTTSPNTPVNLTMVNLSSFETKMNHSYLCKSLENLHSDSFNLKMESAQIEAFRTLPSKTTDFSTANVCRLDDTTDVVPIAIGASLAGLVVFILIIYLIGRRRSRARGYQSV